MINSFVAMCYLWGFVVEKGYVHLQGCYFFDVRYNHFHDFLLAFNIQSF